MEITESFLKSTFDEEYLYSINRNSFVKEPSNIVFKRVYKEKLENDHTYYLILGTDSGLLLNYVLEQDKPDDTRYMFIELPHVIEQLEGKFDLQALPEHVTITTLDKWKDDGAEFGIELYLYKDKCQYLKSIAAIDSFLPAYNEAILRFEQEFQSFRFFTRSTLAVSPFMDTQLRNICENRIPVSLLKGEFTGETCVILAGGPSLDDDIEWVKDNREHMVIVAVSRVANKLLQVGLVPHIIISVDPFEISFDVSKELLRFPSDVLFLHTNNVTPLLLSQWHGRSAYIDRRYPWDVEGDEVNLFSVGPTVTNAALKVMVDIGFENILLSGVDLCFSEKGVSHASGSNEAKVGPTLGQTGKWVETYSGKIVETLVVFEQAAKGLSDIAKEAQSKHISIYNLSSNAANIEHISHVPTQALSFSEAGKSFNEMIMALLPTESRDNILTDYNIVQGNVKKMLQDIKNIKIMAQDALSANTNLFKEKGKESENFKYKIQMDKIEKKFNTRFKKQSKFVKNFGIDKFIKSAQTDSSDEWSDEKVEETGRVYYQAYIDTCVALIRHLESTDKRISSRIEELKPNPDISSFLNQWEQDKVHGRANVWLERNSITTETINDVHRKKLAEFSALFEQSISNQDTKHLARAKKEASLSGVRRKIITLFHQKNADALQTLSRSLKLHMQTNDEAKPLYHLCLAYYANAIGDELLALENFELLPKERLLEDELQQVTAIAFKLKNYDLARACLSQLKDIASTYIPQYAKLLHLLGQQSEAIDVYNMYLSAHPDDTFIWLSLGIFNFDNEAYDAAKLAFELVLSKDNTHQQAKMYLDKISA